LLSGDNDGEYTVADLMLALNECTKLRKEIAQLRAPIRPSLEVLQRMANGIDPFDIGRFKCAMAALPHEAPKLSATVAMFGGIEGIGSRLDRLNRRDTAAV
jgi:cytochrome c556